MRRLALPKVYQLLEPGPVVLLTTINRDQPNIMTMSWHMMVDFEPPTLACVVGEGNYSFGALNRTGQCVIAIPAVRLADKVVGIGNCHGDHIDKFRAFSLTPLTASEVKPPLIKECFANLECKVTDRSLQGKYNLFIMEVLAACVDTAVRNPKTLHHLGYGKFVVDGRVIGLPSKMR
jgi:flavin reductase (DIM6/NTAB) family NADH-FMN oxidoreductase RutF